MIDIEYDKLPTTSSSEKDYGFEEYECVSSYLDNLKVPKDINGSALSLVGRISHLQKMIQSDYNKKNR